MRTLMIFVDGVGIGDVPSVIFKKAPFFFNAVKSSIPVDACLGIEGLPQSGTGQTSLFCGVNSQKIIGRHQYAFPDEKLKDIIKKNNIFSELKKIDKTVCFANAYTQRYLESDTKRRSVTTWMTYYSATEFLTERELLEGKAVYHDITNKSYCGNIEIPDICPEKAAQNLLDIASGNDFTLFEYFLTDRIGHERSDKDLIIDFEAFFRFIVENIPENIAFLLSSDHGNIEIEGKGHSKNSVPLFIKNYNPEYNIRDISQIKELIMKMVSSEWLEG
jgi:hypothetical protein